MRNAFRSGSLRIALAASSVVLAARGLAVTRPEPPLRGAPPRMADARVNMKDSFDRALAARPGLRETGMARARATTPDVASAIASLRASLPALDVRVSGVTGAPALVRNRAGALTPPSPARTEDVVRGFLGRYAPLYGLTAADLGDLYVLGDSAGGASGLRMLRMEQRIGGRPVFQSETRFLVTRDGRLVGSVGQMFPRARSAAAAAPTANLITAPAAVSRLLASVGKTADPGAFKLAGETPGGTQYDEDADYVAGPVTAKQVLFPLAPGVLVPAWSLVVFTEGDADWYAVVDAQTGDVLWRKNMRNYASNHDARFRVFVQADGVTPADSPAPQSPNAVVPGTGTQFPEIAPTIVSMHAAMSATASPNGWIDDCPGGGCTAAETQTLGNNVLACLDRVSPFNACDTDVASVLDGNGRPTGNPDANARNRDFLGTAPRDFQTGFLPPPQGGNPEAGQTATGAGNNGTLAVDQFRRGSVTQLFYVSNWYHDRTYALGFDEGSGNFQQTNFSGSGLGSDRVLADAQDGSGTNNANFSTPPDGTSGRMQMYRFTGPTIDRDGDLDAEIVLHELTHGLSNRLVGNGAGLNWDPAGGLGEGWSDFYALSLLNPTNADDPSARYSSGAYATYKLGGLLDNYVYGIRRFPYSTDNLVNPMTWADVDDVTNDLSGGMAPDPLDFNWSGGMEVHNAGELWALSLWEVRSRVIADPAGANGDVPAGNQTMLQLVTDALKMTPIDPTFTDARDALIDADCATNACANEQSIWAGFADRGLGYGAKTPYNALFGYVAGHLGVKESFQLPYLDVADPLADVTVGDAATNASGAIDPGESVLLTVRLTNPWRAASKAVTGATATLATSTPGVTIWDASATYGAIAPAGTATGDSFLVSVSPSLACGSAIDFTLTTVSNLGTTSTSFRLRVGTRNGTDPVVTYTKDTAPDLAIPDYSPRGVSDTLTVADDLEIADLDLRIDSISHTFTGDLTAMLRSPGGIGVDFMSLIGGLTDGGSGDNVANMVIDDDVASTAANDMVQATSASAPYTKSWLPTFNSPWSALAGFPAADPVGNLSRYDGTSTKGTWALRVSDQAGADTGALNSWSILVTPVHFDCTAFVATAGVGATKTVSGTYQVGQTVTYTVTLVNNGSIGQADNPGNEYTDVLPAGVVLVSATATSGTAVATVGTNTVTWDGSLAPLGGSATVTITATIAAGTQGQTISSQGTVSYDSDGNGTNDATVLTDDPSTPASGDPTAFAVGSAHLTAVKTVAGDFRALGTVTYTIVLLNDGADASADSPTHEMTDVLPAALTLVSATATSGTAVATPATRTVTWDGSLAAGASVTVTITAMASPGFGGLPVSNQATALYDADLDGTAETTVLSDDPGVAGAANPTDFLLAADAGMVVPTQSGLGLLALALGILLAAWSVVRSRA